MATNPTVAEVLAAYPEFSNAGNALVAQKIAEAASTIGEAWEAHGLYTRGVMLTTAHLLALTPEAKEMRLKDGTTRFEAELNRLRRSVVAGLGRVAY